MSSWRRNSAIAALAALVCFSTVANVVFQLHTRDIQDVFQLSKKTEWCPDMSVSTKHALITGGAGFVGRRFSSTLCRMGWKITIVDNLMSESSSRPESWPAHLKCRACAISFKQMDCRAYFGSHLSQMEFDLFIHLATVVGGRATIENSPLPVADDLSIDAAAFQWAIDKKRKKMPSHMVYFSSSAAYPSKLQGVNSDVHLREDMINLVDPNVDVAKPDLTYGWAKLTGEYLALLAVEKHRLNVSVYRPMSGYGEDQHESYPFKAILRRALQRENPISIWNDATRDFFYIQDVVDCVLNTMGNVSNGRPINLGTGIPTSMSELALKMASQVGYDPNVTMLRNMPKGVDYRVGDTSLLDSLGCDRKTSINEGIRLSISFMKGEPIDPFSRRKDIGLKSKIDSRGGSLLSTNSFSQFQCTAGSQKIPWTLQKTPKSFPDANDPEYRVCLLQNVCVINGEIEYYVNESFQSRVPDYLSLRSMGQDFVSGGYLTHFGTPRWSPRIVSAPWSSDVPLDKKNVYLLGSHSFSFNIGHLLIDNIFPGFIAMDLFGFDYDDAQMLMLSSSCNVFPWTISQSLKDECVRNFHDVVPLFHNNQVLWLTKETKPICIRNAIVGHASAFSLKTLDVGRGYFLRKIRNYIQLRLKLPIGKSDGPKILVARKTPGIAPGGESPGWPTLCEDVKKISKVWSTSVECITPYGMTLKNQIQQSWMSSVLVAEHGTTALISLFTQDHTVMISIGKDALVKDPQILLYATHFQTLYMSIQRKEDLQGMLEYAVHKSESSSLSRKSGDRKQSKH